MQLGDICILRSGLTVRGRLPRGGGVLAVQHGDVSAEGEFAVDIAERLDVSPAETHLLAPGELVCRTRGPYWSAWAPAEPPREPLCVIAPLFILHPTTDIDPRYLAWWIGRPAAQRYLGAEARGTGVKMIGKESLARLPVEVPSLKAQRSIVQAASLIRREQELAQRRGDLVHQRDSIRLDRAVRAVSKESGASAPNGRRNAHG